MKYPTPTPTITRTAALASKHTGQPITPPHALHTPANKHTQQHTTSPCLTSCVRPVVASAGLALVLAQTLAHRHTATQHQPSKCPTSVVGPEVTCAGLALACLPVPSLTQPVPYQPNNCHKIGVRPGTPCQPLGSHKPPKVQPPDPVCRVKEKCRLGTTLGVHNALACQPLGSHKPPRHQPTDTARAPTWPRVWGLV